MPRKKRKKHHFLRSLVLLVVALGFVGGGALLLWAAMLKTPDLTTFDERVVAQSTKIFDRTGEVLLFDVHEDIQRTVVPRENISRHVKNATVAIEDAEFYEHAGVKPSAILRAIFTNLKNRDLLGGQGGSTLTQQVVKNSLLTQEKRISRKLKEWVLSLKLEQSLSKDEILTLYLNESPYGGNLYGVEEASRAFFGVSAGDITLAQAAYLAALPQAPTYYSPYGNNVEDLEQRKNTVLQRMLGQGFVSQEEHEQAMNEEVEFLPRAQTGIQAPHFVIYVRELLEQKYGKRVVDEAGFRVITTLDFDLQQRAEALTKDIALRNEEVNNAENAALVAIDPQTGQILAMVGSRDYFDEDIDGNFNVALAQRQPGSAFKPFVYATAFKNGYTPETVVFDLPTQFSTECDPEGEPLFPEAQCYSPVNYLGTFSGPITLREALAQSINVPAVKTLYLSGLSDSLRTARDLGITSLTDPERYGLTLVLGGGEVSPLEMTSAYGVFANDGVYNAPTAIVRIEDGVGNVVEQFAPEPVRVLEARVARTISDILSDNEARAPVFSRQSFLHIPGVDVAAKTGTTNDFRDAWTVGYTPNLAVGVWAGNNDNSSMTDRAAAGVIAPLWNAFVREALSTRPQDRFIPPSRETDELKPILRGAWQGGHTYEIDSLSGGLATEHTPEETRVERVVGNVHSILYWVDKTDPRGGVPDDPESDSQFERWELPVQEWVAAQGIATQTPDSIPTHTDTIHIPANFPRLSINGIDQNTRYSAQSPLTLTITSSGRYPLTRVELYVNGVFVSSDRRSPFVLQFTPAALSSAKTGANTIRVVGVDGVFNRGEQSLQVLFD